MDWDYFCEVDFSELNNDSKEELCAQLAECAVASDANEQDLQNVLILAQKLLQFRGSQVHAINI
jgi:negative regulator of genetic competence, sporulation and motility